MRFLKVSAPVFIGNNAKAGSGLELYFTAGPNESEGILGKLVPVSTDQRGNAE